MLETPSKLKHRRLFYEPVEVDGQINIPISIEAEQGVLGCILLDPLNCLSDCIQKLKGGPEAFHDLRHRTIYETLLEMQKENRSIEMIVVQQVLKDRGVLEGIGGLAYLASLPDVVPSASNLDYYIEIVNEKYTLRTLIDTCREIVARAYDHSGTLDKMLSEVESDISKIVLGKNIVDAKLGPKSAAVAFVDDTEDRYKRQGAPSGILTGYNDLDELTDGLQSGEQFVIGARPSIGKTAFGLNLVVRLGINHKVPTLFISLEQTAKSLMRRMASIYCHVPLMCIKRGNLNEEDLAKLQQFAVDFRKSNITLYDFVARGATDQMIASVINREARNNGIKFVVVDYLQKVIPSGRHEKRTYEVGSVSTALRAAAVSSGVVLVTLAQLNRENEKEKGRTPRISDLADSAQIERDADTIGLLHRDRMESNGPATLLIGKQREGATGNVRLHFNGRYCEFNNGTREEL